MMLVELVPIESSEIAANHAHVSGVRLLGLEAK
jgi:hypothetical protein